MTTHKEIAGRLLPWETLLLFFVTGCLGYEYPLPALLGFVVLLCLVRMQEKRQPIAVFFILACLGFGYTSLRIPINPEFFDVTIPSSRAVRVTGQVKNYSWRLNHQLYVFADNIQITAGTQKCDLPGILLISVKQADHAPLIGQGFHGNIKVKPVHSLKNPGCWNGERYWHRKRVYWRTYIRDMNTSIDWEKQRPSFLEKLRLALRNAVMTTIVDDRGKGLAMALLLGDKSHLNSGMYTILQKAGLIHTLALSGLHLGFAASFGWGIAWGLGILFPQIYLRVPRPKLAAILASPCVLLYMWLGGFTPSLLRAGIMLGSWALLLLCNRGRVLVDGICLAVLLIILASPANIFSISFQFSVLAVTGIIFLVPPVQLWLQSHTGNNIYWRIFRYGVLILCISIAANLAILPLQIWNFGTITCHIYYNIIWLPLLGFIALPLGFSGLLLTQIPFFKYVGGELLKVMGWILGEGYTGLKGIEDNGWLSVIQVLRPQWPEIIGFYIILVVFLLVWRYGASLQKKCIVFLAIGLTLLCVPFIFATITREEQEFRLLAIDTGMSQSIYMDLPGGKRILVDGGGSWSKDFDMGKAFIVPVITWGMPPVIDAVFLTHSDCDHLRGLLYPLETCQIGTFYFNGWYPSSVWDRRRFLAALEQNTITTQKLCAGSHIDLGEDIVIEVLHPKGDLHNLSNNNRSLVLRVVINGKGRVLIPGDIEQKGLADLLASNKTLDADVLILPHHGSITSYSQRLYDKVAPDVAIAAVGQGNRYGFPHPDVVSSLRERGCPVLTTAQCGAIEILWEHNYTRMNINTMRTSRHGVIHSPMQLIPVSGK